jgi:hypothetical protein
MFMSFVRAIASLCGYFLCLSCVQVFAADKSQSQAVPSLENYLKPLGYVAVALRRGPNNELRAAVEVAGRKREFMVDTGCTLTMIDTSLKSKFKTPHELGISFKDAILGVLDNSEEVIIDELRFGTARLLNEPALIKALNSSGGSAFADGILGCDFLLRHFCLIDCSGLRLFMRSERPREEDRASLERLLNQGSMHCAPLHQTSALVSTCKAAIDGNPLVLILDTGSASTMIHSKTAERYKLRTYQTQTPNKRVGLGTIGNVMPYATRPKLFEVDGVEMPLLGLSLGVTDMSSWNIGAQGDPLESADGMLGAEFLAVNRGVIDLADRKLWFQAGTRSPVVGK